MRSSWNSYKYLVDPHTAVAMATAQRTFNLSRDTFKFPKGNPQQAPIIVLSTAHAAKFEESVKAALGDAFWDKVSV